MMNIVRLALVLRFALRYNSHQMYRLFCLQALCLYKVCIKLKTLIIQIIDTQNYSTLSNVENAQI